MTHGDRLQAAGTGSFGSACQKRFGCVALLLQGGGALGAYQGGVFEALAEAGVEPNWVVGISIGAVNAAIIAGNAPAERVKQLRRFWEDLSAASGFDAMVDWPYSISERDIPKSDVVRAMFNQASAVSTTMLGVPGFFAPRVPLPWLLFGRVAAMSFYDTSPLCATLERLVDFDRLNAGEMHVAAGAVNVRSGNFVYFDSRSTRIDPRT